MHQTALFRNHNEAAVSSQWVNIMSVEQVPAMLVTAPATTASEMMCYVSACKVLHNIVCFSIQSNHVWNRWEIPIELCRGDWGRWNSNIIQQSPRDSHPYSSRGTWSYSTAIKQQTLSLHSCWNIFFIAPELAETFISNNPTNVINKIIEETACHAQKFVRHSIRSLKRQVLGADVHPYFAHNGALFFFLLPSYQTWAFFFFYPVELRLVHFSNLTLCNSRGGKDHSSFAFSTFH